MSAISGNPEVTPAANPPTILPTKLPNAYPIDDKKLPPSSTNFVSPGICESAPNATRTNPIIPINADNPNAPSIAPDIGI